MLPALEGHQHPEVCFDGSEAFFWLAARFREVLAFFASLSLPCLGGGDIVFYEEPLIWRDPTCGC